MSIIGADGNPINRETEKEDQKSENANEVEHLTQEEIEKRAEAYPNEIVGIIQCQPFILQEVNKSTGKPLPPKIMMQRADDGRMMVLCEDAEAIEASDDLMLAIQVRSVQEARKRQLMGGMPIG